MINKTTIDKVLDSAGCRCSQRFRSTKEKGSKLYSLLRTSSRKDSIVLCLSIQKVFTNALDAEKAGNSINFVMEHEQLSYVDAVKYLGKK